MSWLLQKFNATQTAEISGLSRVMQRDWRRRNLLSEPDHDAVEASYMRVAKLLSDRGLGPASAQPWKWLVSLCVVSHALRSPQAYDGDANDLPDDFSELRNAILKEAMKASRGRIPAGCEGVVYRAPRFALWTDVAAGVMGDSLDAIYEEAFDGRREATPSVIFDIHAVARDVLRLAGYLVEVRNERPRSNIRRTPTKQAENA